MNAPAWQRAKSLLAEAADLPPGDRERYITEHCPDPELRREVLDLLGSPAPLSHIIAANALRPGNRLGPYVIEKLLGSGGMGEVYQAHDTTLNRVVAIKVLPDQFAGDVERRMRFRREAQLLAALNHPNIAHIHGLDESTGVSALVMELVDGPTLADRLAQGALLLSDALRLAKQIADAVEAAHEQGIVHRDLKPANIKVREDGVVKVLDFGLAKALALETSSSADLRNSPTLSVGATQPGLILGTAAYMPPEQALGKPTDERSDIWAFGCVLYEMLTGTRAFGGADQSDTLSRVITSEPDWAALPPSTPAPIRRLLRRCLEKERQRRLADVADARLEIEEALSGTAESSSREDLVAAEGTWRSVWPWIVAAGCAAALAFVLVFALPRRSLWPSSSSLRLSVDLGTDAWLSSVHGASASLTLSPDGTLLAFVAAPPADATTRLYLRHFDQSEADLMQGTDGAMSPFFSPDGRWIAFFTPGKLNKISVSGGAPVTICEAPNGRGGDWGEDGLIVFQPTNGEGRLLTVPASGGSPTPVSTLDADERAHRWPQLLPGRRAVLYSAAASPAGWGNANIVVQQLPNGPRKVVLRGGYYGRYLPSGHLVYLHDRTLFAAGFDPARLEVTGPLVRAVEGVAATSMSGAGMFAAANSGTLVYLPTSEVSRVNETSIDWVDRSGNHATLRPTPANWDDLMFSPDGRRMAFDIYGGNQWSMWVHDVTRDALTRLTVGQFSEVHPVWSPDARRIAFASLQGETGTNTAYNMFWRWADGTGDAHRLTNSPDNQFPRSWHSSGKILAFEEYGPSHVQISLLPIEGDETNGWRSGKPTAFLSGPFDVRVPTFSPDGRWLAYESNESGQFEVYVQRFPAQGGKRQISRGGGLFPIWSRTRHELLYGTLDQRIMTVAYSADDDSFQAERPTPWPEARYMPLPVFEARRFDLHPDGERLALAPARSAQQTRVELILNFFDELRRIAPGSER